MGLISERDVEGAKWFHISTKGIDRSLFKTREDFLKALNIMAIGAIKYNVAIFAYCLMSNHVHWAVTAASEADVNGFINFFKQSYSVYNRKVHNEMKVFDRVPVTVKQLKMRQDLRNCIAYILRNPVEARICSNADQYPWSSYGCYFGLTDDVLLSGKPIGSIPKRLAKKFLGTHINLSSSNLFVTDGGNILPESFVDSKFVEELFGNSRDELAKSIAYNPYLVLEYELANPVKTSLPQYALVQVASVLAREKFGRNLSVLPLNDRILMSVTLYKDYNASPYEICQILSLSRKTVNQILGLSSPTNQ